MNRYRVDVDIIDRDAMQREGGNTILIVGLEAYAQAQTKDAARYAVFDQLDDAGEVVCRLGSVEFLSEV